MNADYDKIRRDIGWEYENSPEMMEALEDIKNGEHNSDPTLLIALAKTKRFLRKIHEEELMKRESERKAKELKENEFSKKWNDIMNHRMEKHEIHIVFVRQLFQETKVNEVETLKSGVGMNLGMNGSLISCICKKNNNNNMYVCMYIYYLGLIKIVFSSSFTSTSTSISPTLPPAVSIFFI